MKTLVGAMVAALGVLGAESATAEVPVKKLAPYLYETWYDGYEDSDLKGDDGPFGDLPVEGLGGCSSVRVGDFHGRNLDIGVSDCATVVVHMKAGGGRLASVGTTQWGDVTETALSTNGVSAHRFDVLPSWMLDGINEKGVAINVNVVPLDVPQLGVRLVSDKRPSLHARKVVRYVLDHAVSAADAVKRLKGFHVFGNIGTGTYHLHWMISDLERTYVVEIIRGEVVAREHPIMTNFNLNWDNKNQRAIAPSEFASWGPERYVNPAIYGDNPDQILETYTPHADGIERYLTLRDAPYATKGRTFEGMFDLLREARYSRVADLPLERTFRSDLTEIDEVQEAGLGSLVRIYAAGNAEKLRKVWATLRPAMTNVYAHLAEYRNPDDLGDYTITTHNVTFDLRRRMFRIVVQEDYDHPHDIWLASNEVEVKCRNGVFVGECDAQTKIASFKGIPYAKPPVGALRWKAPVAAEASCERRDAKAFGSSALQSVDKGEAASKREKSEDCLTLNVWTADPEKKNRPVMVFIHGGSYGWGGSSDPLYDGAPFVAENPDIVLVTVNYRVNFMGFIDFAKVPGGEEFPDAPYLGLLDQQLALRWVKENIAGFGGDPQNVTIFGESAGGGSVSCHLVMPGSKGLFRRAIVMSGTLDLTCSQTMLDNRGQTELLLKAAGVRDMAGLMALSEKDLLKLMFAECGKESLEGVDSRVSDSNNWPMRGGRSPIPANPFQALKDGASKDVDVMIGTVADEMRYWAYLQVDDDHVARLRAAGAIFIFQTTVPEFCASCMTWSRLYGVTRNPWNLPYGTGGSSGGSAASLASGFCTLATGSDMGGSIRIPASMCGVYGFKPPFGRVPCCESTYIGNGPLARTFGDMVLMQDVMCGPSDTVYGTLRPKLDYPSDYAPIKRKKVAVAYMRDWVAGGCDVDVVKAMDETVAALKCAGAEVVKVELGWKASEIMPTYVAGILTDDVYVGAPVYREYRDILCPYLSAFYAHVDKAGPEAVIAAHNLQSQLHEQLQQEVFRKGCLALVMPSLLTAHVPADIESTPEKLADVNGKPSKGIDFCLTPVFNLLNNYPVVTVPVAFSRRNVPIGVQVIGNTFDDLMAMRVSAALSKVVKPNFRDGRFPDFRSSDKSNGGN